MHLEIYKITTRSWIRRGQKCTATQSENHYFCFAWQKHQKQWKYIVVSLSSGLWNVYFCNMVRIEPHCGSSKNIKKNNWKYNLTRHMRYECGTESRFQCAHCKRCFPHKQNAIHHNIRKHRIHYEKNHLYVDNGDVIIKTIV